MGLSELVSSRDGGVGKPHTTGRNSAWTRKGHAGLRSQDDLLYLGSVRAPAAAAGRARASLSYHTHLTWPATPEDAAIMSVPACLARVLLEGLEFIRTFPHCSSFLRPMLIC